MKALVLILSGLFVANLSIAGNEVPWPVSSQEAVRVSDLTGTWMSMSIKEPGYFYFFSFTNNYNSYLGGCPYLLKVEEMNPFDQEIISKGWSVACAVDAEKMTFDLFDAAGHLHNRLEIVGLKKENDDSGKMGQQYLGIKIYDNSSRPKLLDVDTFFKHSNKTQPVWPGSAENKH